VYNVVAELRIITLLGVKPLHKLHRTLFIALPEPAAAAIQTERETDVGVRSVRFAFALAGFVCHF
tara:strand:+ start:524 stop:718 length:195 start_codon:yes stop_codon:yes gene_type:complete